LIRLITAYISFCPWVTSFSIFPHVFLRKNEAPAEKLSTHFHKAKIAYDAGQLNSRMIGTLRAKA